MARKVDAADPALRGPELGRGDFQRLVEPHGVLFRGPKITLYWRRIGRASPVASNALKARTDYDVLSLFDDTSHCRRCASASVLVDLAILHDDNEVLVR